MNQLLRVNLVLFLLVSHLTDVSAQETAHPSVALPPELERVLRDYETAWRAEDENGLANLFTVDGFVLSSNVPPVRGRQNIVKRYEESGGPLALRALAYEISGDIAYIIGGFSLERGQADIGKFTLILKKSADGHWLIVSDMDNGNG